MRTIISTLVACHLMVSPAASQGGVDSYQKSQQDHEAIKRANEKSKQADDVELRRLQIERDQLVLGNAASAFKEREAAARRIAMAKYPSLADKTSPDFKRMQEAVGFVKENEPAFFKQPNWPLLLADRLVQAHAPAEANLKVQEGKGVIAEASVAKTAPTDAQIAYQQAQQTIKYLEAMLALTQEPEVRQRIAQVLAVYSAVAPPPPNAPEPGTPQSIESHISGTFEGWGGKTVFKLDNGQIWQQAQFDYYYHYAYRPSVIIDPTTAGWKMKVDGVAKSIIVRRIK